MNARRNRLIGELQKVKDLLDYVWHRGRMLRQVQMERRQLSRATQGRIETILLVRLGSIGDVVRATAVIPALRQRYPTARIDLLTSAAARGLVDGNPDLGAVYDLDDLKRLGTYDWVINLQNPYPLAGFLKPGLSYHDVLDHISNRLSAKLVSGRSLRGGLEVTTTNVLYCLSEMEELFLIALLPFDAARYPKSTIQVDPGLRAATKAKFNLPNGPMMGLFLGSNSVGCGADEGFRTYSIDYLERIIRHFSERFTIVMIGQSNVRTTEELSRYRAIVSREPRVIDLVDKTTLPELASVIDELEVVISCDSSPIHLAQARGIPVVALFVLEATFRIGPKLEYEGLIGLNSVKPCFPYTWRWKYFCNSCRDPKTRAAYCYHDTYAFGVDRIPIDRVDGAVRKLLQVNRQRPAAQS